MMEEEAITLRRYGVREQLSMPYAEFKARLLKTIGERMQAFAEEV